MKLLTSKQEISKTFNKLLTDCKSVSFAVAWASCGFASSKLLLESRKKIRTSVVGTHFYQTDPKFIEEFIGNESVKFVTATSGVFHPKIYLFEGQDKRWDCLIGSANFTNGAFGGNTEVLVHINSKNISSNDFIRKLRKQIVDYWYSRDAIFASEIDLDKYKAAKKQNPTPKTRSIAKISSNSRKLAHIESEIRNAEWQVFFKKVQKAEQHNLSDRIQVLQSARSLFDEYGSLKDMPDVERKSIAGFVSSDKTKWPLFGAMGRAHTFTGLINKNPKIFSQALDKIPIAGPVRREDYLAFIKIYESAFPLKNGKRSGHGFATATRLLAMKRPDYFVCLSKANKTGLKKAFRCKLKTHDYEAYWDLIIEPICRSNMVESS